MSPSLLVQLLDGRMSKKGTCMLAYRGLLGALKEHEAFDPDGPSAAALVDASECCSITALIGFKVRCPLPPPAPHVIFCPPARMGAGTP